MILWCKYHIYFHLHLVKSCSFEIMNNFIYLYRYKVTDVISSQGQAQRKVNATVAQQRPVPTDQAKKKPVTNVQVRYSIPCNFRSFALVLSKQIGLDGYKQAMIILGII